MATPVILVLVIVAMVSLVAVGSVIMLLLARLRGLMGELEELEDELTPTLRRLQQDADVTGAELERVSGSLDRLSERERPGRRSTQIRRQNLVDERPGPVDSATDGAGGIRER